MPAFVSLFLLILIVGAAPAGYAADSTGHEHRDHFLGVSDTLGPASVLILLTTGFLTGLSHCVGMCGPLVSAFAVQRSQRGGSLTRPLLLYQLGRLSSYVSIGLATGAIGSSVRLAAVGRGWQVGLALFIGTLMLVIALGLSGVIRARHWPVSAFVGNHVASWLRRAIASNHPAAPLGLGLANGMLPCGPVYAMALLAAGMQSLWQGGLLMLAFGLGTVPAMLATGFSLASLGAVMRTRLFRLAALLIALVGLQQILRGLALAGLLDHFRVGPIMLW